MAGATVKLVGATTVVLSDGGRATPWNGSGMPWNGLGNTPFEIANNDVTGERFVITAPARTPIQSGGGIFVPWLETIGVQYGNRQVVIPIQARASSQSNLQKLLNPIRELLFGGAYALPVYLTVTYGGLTVDLLVEGGTLQEGPQFWNDENDRGLLRATLTLECRIGAGAEQTVTGGTTFTNAVIQTALLGSLKGDLRRVGQPLIMTLEGGDIALGTTKLIYAAVCSAAADSGSLSESLATSSTSGVTAAGAATIGNANVRALRYRTLAQITSPSSNLQVRLYTQYANGSGQIVAQGSEWISVGTSTIILDLGYAKPQLPGSGNLHCRLQYRSSNGAATSGTLSRVRALAYYTFCKITTPNATGTNGRIDIASPSPSNEQDLGGSGITSGGAVVYNSTPAIEQICTVAGSLPVAILNGQLFLAWTSNGVFDPADTITVAANTLPLYETLPV